MVSFYHGNRRRPRPRQDRDRCTVRQTQLSAVRFSVPLLPRNPQVTLQGLKDHSAHR